MKRFLIISSCLGLFALSSCRTYKTCPTYAKNDIKQEILASKQAVDQTKN
ncbi:hypothetical protein [Flammeovirga pacifica]|nr:hypothetical protein [Flammeovirga pacifica]